MIDIGADDKPVGWCLVSAMRFGYPSLDELPLGIAQLGLQKPAVSFDISRIGQAGIT
ncbi:hypothetical protein [Bradyrhizobium neotropicale]|uniref:hypothetical protein n=1 Tax=Bradyrhizobium neotropicale TaxID=1497615 RepID=UPI001AD66911|nr:hypothetical protein [Bradyrhizobium neotropicale]MBO4223814.1 hypothetical protein [Bradyrhizobium neotropicale]